MLTRIRIGWSEATTISSLRVERTEDLMTVGLEGICDFSSREDVGGHVADGKNMRESLVSWAESRFFRYRYSTPVC